MSPATILVVDDDADTRGLVRRLLERAGYSVREAEDGLAGLRELFALSPDLVLLDVTMPGLDGWATLERIREVERGAGRDADRARHRGVERVRGLSRGADDYIAKPFGRQELVARVHALLRRARTATADVPSRTPTATSRSTSSSTSSGSPGEEVQLTPLEFRLLAAFVRHPNQVLSRDQLLELVWGDSYGVSRDQVKLYVGYLRRKLGAGRRRERRRSRRVRGFGYRYRRPG